MSSNSIILGPNPAAMATALQTVLLMHFENNFVEETGKAMTVSGSPTFSSNTVNGTKDLRLVGAENVMTTNYSTDFVFGTDDLTIECFFYNTQVSGSPESLVTLGSTDTAFNGLSIGYDPGTGKVYVANRTSGAFTSAAAGSVTNWPHLAYSRKAGRGRLFVNGVMKTEVIDTTPVNSGYCAVGKNLFGGGNWYGYIDEVRVSKGARYWDNFTPEQIPQI